MRRFRMVGAALLAVLAVTAVTASMAAAAEWHAESSPVTLDGTQVGTDVFTVNGGTTECGEATYSGSIAAVTSATASVTPTYTNCTLKPFGTAHVTATNCHYEATIDSVTETDFHGTLHINCTAGASITVVGTAFGVTKCTVHVGSQTVPITIKNGGSGKTRDVTIEVNYSKLKYSQTAGSGLGACSTETAENGKYVGTATITGTTSGGAQQGVWAG